MEEEFAEFAGSEAALYFGSGYAANIGLLTSLAGKDDVIFSDALNHASIIDGIRLSGARKVIYPHRDLQRAGVRAETESNMARGAKLIVTETVFSMDGDIAPVDDIVALAAKIWRRGDRRRSARHRRSWPRWTRNRRAPLWRPEKSSLPSIPAARPWPAPELLSAAARYCANI